MTIFLIILLTIIIICLIMIYYVSVYNHFQNYIIRINEAEANIDSTLRKRFDLLKKSVGVIEASSPKEEANDDEDTEEKKSALQSIDELRSKKISNFELDRELYNVINEFNAAKENNPKLKENESFVKIELGLNESESEIIAFRKYYNDIITDYNKLVRSFPSNIVSKMSKYRIKPYFDGKDMEDDDTQDMKL